MEKFNIPDINDAIIITRHEYFPMIYQWKNTIGETGFRLMDKEEVFDLLSFTCTTDPIPYLIQHKHFDYTTSKEYLRLLRVGDYSKNAFLSSLYEELKERFFFYDDLGMAEFQNRKVYLLELPHNTEVRGILTRNGISYTELSFDDLGLEKVTDAENLPLSVPIRYFQNRFEQFFTVFSQLRKRVIDHPEEKNRIRVLVKDDTERFYFGNFSEIFALPVTFSSKVPYFSGDDVLEAVRKIYQNRSFVLTEEDKEKKSLSTLVEVIDKYHLPELDFDFAYSNLLEILSSLSRRFTEEGGGITFTTDFVFDRNQLVYVLDFVFGPFYEESKNKTALSDEERKAISVSTSYEQTEAEAHFKSNYLFYNHIVLLSRVTQHLNDHLFDSQFIDDYSWKNYVKKVRLSDVSCQDGAFTSTARKIDLVYQNDRLFRKNKSPELDWYDPSYNGISNYRSKKSKYSITAIENYVACPFSYLMKEILPLDIDDYHRRWFGTMVHSMLEEFYHPGYELDKAWKKGVETYRKEVEKVGMAFTPKEEVYLAIAKPWLTIVLRLLMNENREIGHYPNNEDYERKFEITLHDENGKEYPFVGTIDKLLTTTTGKANYVTILDYKTGAEEFSPYFCFLGKGIQLPIYCYALKEHPELLPSDNFSFGGFAIQHIYPTSFTNGFLKNYAMTEEALTKTLTAKGGLVKNDEEYIRSLNLDYVPNQKVKGKGKGKSDENPPTFFSFNMEEKDGKYYLMAGSRKPEKYCFPLESLIKDSIDVCIRTVNAIQQAEFPIAPMMKNPKGKNSEDNACKYCHYKDVCFHRKQDVASTRNAVLAHNEPYRLKGETE